MSYTAYERETVLTCDDETKMWTIYTLQPPIITRLRKAGIEPFQIDKDGGHHYKEVAFRQVSFRSKSKGREMTDEQRREAAERFKRAREEKEVEGDIK
ncbi:hypothetical protein EEL30_21685 [Brevibacillus laterosporus]|uniref:Uncharacterized protein n=1 Tax=Brevibacillus laterosporus TaxID=1465 RepID=A0A518VFU6_BRELA|nr:hypothetical protein EEL30_21685 [Brevibacillus laterosporus]